MNSARGGPAAGFRRITRLGPQTKVRLLGVLLTVVCGALVLLLIKGATWTQLNRLQDQHEAVTSESFYSGVALRSAVRSLNDQLLHGTVWRDPEARAQWLQDCAAVKAAIREHRQGLGKLRRVQIVQPTQEPIRRMELTFDQYTARAGSLLERAGSSNAPAMTERADAEMRKLCADMLQACDDLVGAQRAGLSNFFEGTKATLATHELLLKVSWALILALLVALALLVHRGLIAPLRVRLDQSQTIIERQEKLASLGVLASGVAHEIRNPLTAIKFRLFSLKQAVPALAANEDAVTISNEINRLERIVKDFLQFARPSEPQLSRISARQVLEEVRTLMGSPLERQAIQLRVDAPADLALEADGQQLKQALINLVQNAAESIRRQGTITLRLRSGAAESNGHTQPAAVIGVIDTGKGIPAAVQARLFDPFFTTKDGGTGLGLATASRIIEKHGGLLRYQTDPARGTTFELVLPAHAIYATQSSADRGRPEHSFGA